MQTRLFHELGQTRVARHSARAYMGSDASRLFDRVETDLVSVVVDADRADEVFTWLYHEAHVADREERFLYMMRLSHATAFELPADVPMEDAGQG